MIAKFVTTGVFRLKRCQQTILEVKVHIYGQINGQKYKFPAFTGKKRMCTQCVPGPFSSPSKGLGMRLDGRISLITPIHVHTPGEKDHIIYWISMD